MSGPRKKRRRTPLPKPEELLTREGKAELHKFLQQYQNEMAPVFSEYGIDPADGMLLFWLNRVWNTLDTILEVLDEIAEKE